MQNKYDIIAQEIEIDDVKMFNEDGNGTHTPTVYEYVKHSINNEEGFLAWLFDDGDIESKYDLDEEQQEELDEFVEFCIPDDVPVDIEECYHDRNERAFIVKDVYGRTYDVCCDESDCTLYYEDGEMRDMLRSEHNLSDSAIDKVIEAMHADSNYSPLIEDKKRILEEHNLKEGVDFRFGFAGELQLNWHDDEGNDFWQ